MEYRFKEKENYSSIELVRTKNYSLEDTSITFDEIKDVYDNIKDTEVISDDMNVADCVPFIQADNFERIVSLLENMYENPMTSDEIIDLMKFTSRQRDYYFNAGKYLGLFQKIKEDNVTRYGLTDIGVNVYKKSYKDRQLELVKLILSHRIFRELFGEIIETGMIPDKGRVVELELEYNVCSIDVASRRSTSVISWLNWIFNLVNI